MTSKTLPSRLSLSVLPSALHTLLQQVASNPAPPGTTQVKDISDATPNTDSAICADPTQSTGATQSPDSANSADPTQSTRATPNTVNVEIPFTGETLGTIADGTEEDVEAAFATARTAQPRWERTTLAARKRIFLRYHDLILQHRDLLTDMIQLETGKDRGSALDEVLDVAMNARFYAHSVEKILKEQRHPGALPLFTKTVQQRVPRGVVGQISPWNYPLTLGISDAIPALLAGNAVVAKPDSGTPFCSLLALHLLREAGLPADTMQIVTGSGKVVGEAIARRCDYLMFTGSTKTGKLLGRIAGERLIGYSAELGGKNPMIVAADANIDRAVHEALSACFSNTGQLCVSIERIYVEAPVYEQFVEGFSAAVRKMKLGAGLNWHYDVGSLASQQQLNTVEHYVRDAKEHGARVLAGGQARPDLGPYFYEPTVLEFPARGEAGAGLAESGGAGAAGVPGTLGAGAAGAGEPAGSETDQPTAPEIDQPAKLETDQPTTTNPDPSRAALLTEEVFGPVVYVEKVATIFQAVHRANDTDYGLNASVFAAPKTGQMIARQLRAGSVSINDGYASAWASVSTPSGGMKESGMGRRHGAEGLLKYTESRNVAEQRVMSLRGPAWLPRGEYARVMSTALRLGKRFLP